MNKPSKNRGTKPLFAKLPVSLHIAVQKLSTKRWEDTGSKPSQRQLIIEAITRLVELEGINVPQIEERVSKWNKEESKPGKVSVFPRKRGHKPT